MSFTIDLDQEVDGRWIAEVPELNVLLYGTSRLNAIELAQAAAREIVPDRIAHGEVSPDCANAVFRVVTEDFDDCRLAELRLSAGGETLTSQQVRKELGLDE